MLSDGSTFLQGWFRFAFPGAWQEHSVYFREDFRPSSRPEVCWAGSVPATVTKCEPTRGRPASGPPCCWYSFELVSSAGLVGLTPQGPQKLKPRFAAPADSHGIHAPAEAGSEPAAHHGERRGAAAAAPAAVPGRPAPATPGAGQHGCLRPGGRGLRSKSRADLRASLRPLAPSRACPPALGRRWDHSRPAFPTAPWKGWSRSPSLFL